MSGVGDRLGRPQRGRLRGGRGWRGHFTWPGSRGEDRGDGLGWKEPTTRPLARPQAWGRGRPGGTQTH